MNHKRVITYFICLIIGTFALNAQNDNHFVHTVSKGQTLYSISRMYEVSVNDIIALNPECAQKLAIGYKLKIAQKKKATNTTEDNEKRYHTIQPGETLFRLGQTYGITPQEICAANPGLSIGNFRAGEVILIPRTQTVQQPVEPTQPQKEEKKTTDTDIRTTHKVEKGETLYSLARRYGVTEDELLAANPELKKKKLKRKSIIAIPYSQKEIAQKAEQEKKKIEKEQSNAEIFRKIEEAENKNSIEKGQALKVAVVLPFMLGTYSPTEQTRMVEYYEGFLMAVERLKQYGYSFEINTYDSGKESNSLAPLLDSGKLNDANIIFGALYPSHNKQLAQFAKKKEIPLVIPFTSKEDEIFRNPMVYVVNTMQSYFFSEVIDHFTRKFSGANVIFVESDNSNKKEFVATLKKSLDKNKQPHTTLSMELFNGQEPDYISIKAAMKSDRKNIFIPTSGSETTLSSLLAPMLLMKNDTINELPEFTLFGYPEWQIYASNMQSKMYEVGTYFYTSIFSHASFAETIRFQQSYTEWYSHMYQNIYPRYSMLGYDTGYYFLLAASKYGKNMADNINNVTHTPIQTGFKFERGNNWGGFVNKKIYFVHYTPEYKVEKIDFDK